MEHKSSSFGFHIPKAAAIVILLAFLTVNVVLWTHIRQQEITILELQTKIAALEHCKAIEEMNRQREFHRLSYEELFRRIDDNH